MLLWSCSISESSIANQSDLYPPPNNLSVHFCSIEQLFPEKYTTENDKYLAQPQCVYTVYKNKYRDSNLSSS